MPVRTLPRLPALLAAAGLIVACKSASKEPAGAKPSASGVVSAASSAPPPEPAAPPAWSNELQPDPAFQAELEAAARRCTYLAARNALSCPKSVRDSLKAKIHEQGAAALETLLLALARAEPATKELAAHQLSGAYELSLGPSLSQAPIPPRVVSALIDALEELPASDAGRVAPVATFAATREGRLETIAQILERRPEFRGVILPRIMRYPRLKAFDEVKKWASDSDEQTVLTALEAVQFMDNWTDDERARFGAWLSGFLDHKSSKVQGKAAAFLLYCGDQFVKRSLTWFDSALASKRLTREAIFAYARRCHPNDPAMLKQEKPAELAGSPLCAKLERRFDRVAADEGSDGGLREAALQGMISTWPKTTLSRAQKLTGHSDSHLAQTAQNVVQALGEEQKE